MVKCQECNEGLVQTGQATRRKDKVVTHTYHKCTNDYCSSYGVPVTLRKATGKKSYGLPVLI